MSMYTQITITHPGRAGAKIADKWLNRVEFFEPSVTVDEDSVEIEANSKYENEDARIYGRRYSEKHPEATVEIHQEWTGDGGPSIEDFTYQGGELINTAHNAQVPGSLPALIAELRASHKAWDDSMDPNGYEPTPAEAEERLGKAVTALLDALDAAGVGR